MYAYIVYNIQSTKIISSIITGEQYPSGSKTLVNNLKNTIFNSNYAFVYNNQETRDIFRRSRSYNFSQYVVYVVCGNCARLLYVTVVKIKPQMNSSLIIREYFSRKKSTRSVRTALSVFVDNDCTHADFDLDENYVY